MRSALRRIYGAPGWHLPLMLGCLALGGYCAHLLSEQPMFGLVIIWFLACVLAYDLVLAPLVATADRVLAGFSRLIRGRERGGVPVINHVRLPVLGAGLLFLMFLPGIVQQGTETHLAASGLGQEPYLERWLWLSGAFAASSSAIYIVRVMFRIIRVLFRRAGRGGTVTARAVDDE